MIPVICQIGPLQIYSYGVMFAIAVFVCAFLLSREAHALSIPPESIYDFIFWVVLAGILGARIFYILLNVDYFLHNPIETIKIQNGGIAWQGGLIGGFLAGLIYIRRKKWPLWKFLDLTAPYIALGQAIGRIGCFLNGCCYGKEVSWGIYFPVHHAHLHPTQLYDSFGLFVMFFLLKKFQKTSRAAGHVFIVYLIAACSQRFLIEFFRADHDIVVWGLSIFQLVCLMIVGLSVIVLIRRR